MNDFPGSAAFFCLHTLWRLAITLIIDHLSTEFKFCRFVLSAAPWTSRPLCRARSAEIKITSANVHFEFLQNDCSDYKRQVSVWTRQHDCQSSLTLSIGSTPAKLIGPVEACRLSGVNTSMPGGDRSSDLNLKPSPDPGNIMTPSTAAGGDEGEIRVLVQDCGDKMLQLSSNCIWHL